MKKSHTPRRPRHGSQTTTAHRQRQLGQIHQAKKQLGLDDETYRALLQRVTGKASAADMSGTEREAVIETFVKQGFVPPARAGVAAYPNRPKHTSDVPMLRKVEALLADAKRPWNYAHGMALQMFGRERLEFLRDEELHKLVQALEVDARRRRKRKWEEVK